MSYLQLLLCLIILSSDLLLLCLANSITLSLSRVPPPTTNPLESLKYHAAASKARAYNLKHPNAKLPLYPRRYGAYSANLSFGTPLQTLPLIMDTANSLVWFPCTHNFHCTHCRTVMPTFIPNSSSSYKNITCDSQQCKWLQDSKCNNNHTECVYRLEIGLWYTKGRLLSEKLTIPGLSADDFIVGCSVSSSHTPDGIVGFGHTKVSLPAQLGLTSFSYCLVPHDLLDNDPPGSSDLVLTTTGGGGEGAHGKIKYTPFVSNAAFPDYYYVYLKSISIGGVDIQVPAEYLVPDKNGNGGTIFDSGTTLTQMEQPVFDLVFKELDKQVGKTYTRARNIEKENGLLWPCYNVSVGGNQTKFPQLTLYFEGDTKMDLPNYFTYLAKSVVCLTIENSGKVEPGPTIILGNYQQHNYYIKYDLENSRLGIVPQKCG